MPLFVLLADFNIPSEEVEEEEEEEEGATVDVGNTEIPFEPFTRISAVSRGPMHRTIPEDTSFV